MQSFESFIETHHRIIYKICRVYSDRADFDDLYQEILINLWQSRSRFKGNSKESTWVYRVALNVALTYKRDTSRRRRKLENYRNDLVTVEYDEPEQEQANTTELLYRAIATLGKNERPIILLYLEQHSYEEISDIMGISISNVGVRLNRLKKKLHNILTDGALE